MTESSFGNFHVFPSKEAYEANKGSMGADDIAFVPYQPMQGPQGPAGPAGAAGPQGPAGKSAYQAAQQGGFTGTEAEFNAWMARAVRGPSTFQQMMTGGFR